MKSIASDSDQFEAILSIIIFFHSVFYYVLGNVQSAVGLYQFWIPTDNNKVLSEENKRLVWKCFKNSQLFVILWLKPDNNRYFILSKKSVKRTVRRQPRNSLDGNINVFVQFFNSFFVIKLTLTWKWKNIIIIKMFHLL